MIGEIASRVLIEQKEFAASHAQIPWQQMRGMRNRMAHGYFDINLDVVWETVQVSLAELDSKLTVLAAPSRGATNHP